MKTELETQNTECTRHASGIALLAVGLGVGVVFSMLFAPRSGAETRKVIATKCLNGVETANEKVRQARTQIHQFVDQAQETVSAAVIAQREALGKTDVEKKPQIV